MTDSSPLNDVMSKDRYVPDVPFPPYAFVPGRHPHPVTDANGHSFGKAHSTPQPLDAELPRTSHEFLYAIDLFNAGYYWEAHEAWEGLWNAAGRSGTQGNFLKGLIKLAAAGVKARVGQSNGVLRHGQRAVELFQSVKSEITSQDLAYAGLSIDKLITDAEKLVADPVVDLAASVQGRAVLPIQLQLQ